MNEFKNLKKLYKKAFPHRDFIEDTKELKRVMDHHREKIMQGRTLKPARCRECNDLYMGEPHEENVCSKCIGNFPKKLGEEKWTLVKLGNNKFHVVSTSGKLIKIDHVISQVV